MIFVLNYFFLSYFSSVLCTCSSSITFFNLPWLLLMWKELGFPSTFAFMLLLSNSVFSILLPCYELVPHLGMQIKERLPVLLAAGVSTDSVLFLEWKNREREQCFPKKCKIQHLCILTCQDPVCTKDGMKNFTNKIPILLLYWWKMEDYEDTNEDRQNTVLFLAWIRWFRKSFLNYYF